MREVFFRGNSQPYKMMKLKFLLSGAALAGTCAVLPAAVTISSYSQTVQADADDTTIAGVVSSSTVTGYPPTDESATASQGVASASATIDFTAGTVGLPAALGNPVTAFDLQFEGAVFANVATGTSGSSASSSAQLGFTVQVLNGEADFTFTQTGNNADLRFFVDGIPAQNTSNTIRRGVGIYNVLFSDGAGAFTENAAQSPSEQINTQNYTLSVVEVIPEPSTALLGGIALLGLLRRRR